MNVTEAVLSRRSVRAFLDWPVPGETIREIVAKAALAPSSSNLQPWIVKVVGGAPLIELKARIAERGRQAPPFEAPDYMIYPPELKQPYFDRRATCAANNYAAAGVGRDDDAGRLGFLFRMVECYGAPLALFTFIDRSMGPSQWADLGCYIQTVMLLLREAGLDSCAQVSFTLFSRTIGEFLRVPPDLMLYCGMSIGYRDPDSPLAAAATSRAGLEEFAEFVGL